MPVAPIYNKYYSLASHRDIMIGHQPLVIDKYKVSFFLIPKVCTNSIKTVTRPFNPRYCPLEEIPEDYEKIAIVRNPLDRLVSCFTNKVQQKDVHETWKMNDRDPLPTYPEMEFKEFAMMVYNRPDDISDRHYRSQSAQLKLGGKFLPTQHFQFESLIINWAAIQKILPVSDLPIKNKSSQRLHYTHYYDRQTRLLMLERYAEDVERFYPGLV